MTLNELANFKKIPLAALEEKYPFEEINGYWELDELFEESEISC